MYYTVYKITNRVNGKFYIGTHKTVDPNDDYMGSGTLLKRAVQKYGLDNFTKEVLFVFDNPEDMFAKEAEIVTEEFLAEENTYNLKIGGFGGWDYVNRETSERLEKNQVARKNADLTILSKYGVNNPSQIPNVRQRRIEKNKKMHADGVFKYRPSFSGKHHSDETKRKIGSAAAQNQLGRCNSQFDSMWITNTSTKQNMKIHKTSSIPEGWVKGRKMY